MLLPEMLFKLIGKFVGMMTSTLFLQIAKMVVPKNTCKNVPWLERSTLVIIFDVKLSRNTKVSELSMRLLNIIFIAIALAVTSCNKSQPKEARLSFDTDTTKIVNGKILDDTLETEFYETLLDSFPFDNFRVKAIYNGAFASIKLADYRDITRESRDDIQTQYNNNKMPNFAGHYLIVTWGCGSPCEMNSIIDVTTGKNVSSFSTSLGLKYRVDSYLLIKNPPVAEVYRRSDREIFGNPEFLIFRANKLIKISSH